MRALGLLLAAAVLAACSSPPVTVDLPPTVHRGTTEAAAGMPHTVHGMASEGHCWFFRDSPDAAKHPRGPDGHPRRSPGSEGTVPSPSPPQATSPPSSPEPSVAVPTSVTTCHTAPHRYAS